MKKEIRKTDRKTHGFRPEDGALDKLRKIAKRERRSLNWVVNEAIRLYLAGNS